MTRAVDEWIGKTPDTPVPPRVRLRVFQKYDGKCYLSGRRIMPGDLWQVEHKIALVNWSGEGHGNRESNLAPVLAEKHKEKTRDDVAEKSMIYRKRSKHIGIRKKIARPMPGSRASKWKKKLNGEVVPR